MYVQTSISQHLSTFVTPVCQTCLAATDEVHRPFGELGKFWFSLDPKPELQIGSPGVIISLVPSSMFIDAEDERGDRSSKFLVKILFMTMIVHMDLFKCCPRERRTRDRTPWLSHTPCPQDSLEFQIILRLVVALSNVSSW